MAALIRDILSQIRRAVSGLKQQDLSAQLASLKRELVHHGFTVSLITEHSRLSAVIESCLILILTEAVTNILRHSQGDTVDIRIEDSEQELSLWIADNGQLSAVTMGNGLNGIVQRCEELNGSCNIQHQQSFSLAISLAKVAR